MNVEGQKRNIKVGSRDKNSGGVSTHFNAILISSFHCLNTS